MGFQEKFLSTEGFNKIAVKNTLVSHNKICYNESLCFLEERFASTFLTEYEN